ncbi:DUF2721 domain-containing protein [Roseivirga pacifica]|uniref:DUF2721 domain-containing protein n=1 Tax=Roseivirga pacifica TaxID=1267423 RepID=UPI00209488C4|nr:DUF2721 domain-containing protein [Roseivirga pacifica]MCO6358652.1 DUF2721 domain-containing protein [Roseivirga pacifica]MCO6365712.1 DUF2721 domain-containing protein [Roseivirga pacifica]MCO6371558.1 DUF2721 domain-containing protein [Roseivirga pacifica]MCO6376331.1 DUF2721 domain-containing protein [Roseivirga pacifica]MCO6378936.1 DUF2721 domain-containing protein [Roseivirga pacifica]
MTIDLSTPALLFPAITLLLLAYTNRFVALANLARGLRQRYKESPDMDSTILGQIKNLRVRLLLIRNMQALGIASFFSCVLCMVVMYLGRQVVAEYIFGLSLFLLLGSLLLSFIETQISTKAISIELSDLASKSVKK